MSEPTRKPRTSKKPKKGERRPRGPESKIQEQNITEGAIPWREALSDVVEEDNDSGLYLKGLRKREGLTQKELAEALSDESRVSQHHISDMESGKRPISKKMAHKLATVLGGDYRLFL